MSKVSTEKILSLIRDNGNLPFYVFAHNDELYDDEYSYTLQEIRDISIDKIWHDDGAGRIYVLSYDEEDLIDEYLDGIFDDIGEDEYNKHDDDYWENVAEAWVESLDWKKCIIAWADGI